MLVKSYFVARVEEALAAAAQELGGDALLVTTRRTTPEQEHLGRYEAVFALDTPGSHVSAREADPEVVQEPLASVREKLEEVRRTLGAASNPPRAGVPATILLDLQTTGIGVDLAREICVAIGAAATSVPAAWKTVACRVLEEKLSRLPACTPLVPGETFAVAGPAGRGKTTVLAKLALRYRRDPALRLRILSFDAPGSTGSSPARYPSLGDVPLQSVRSLAELRHALQQPFDGVTLVDTPGPGPGGFVEAGLASVCRHAPRLSVHLVLRADAALVNLQQSVERLRHYNPASLLFTGLDEVSAFGSIAALALSTGLPASFLCASQSPGQELEVATPARLAELAIYGQRMAARAAA